MVFFMFLSSLLLLFFLLCSVVASIPPDVVIFYLNRLFKAFILHEFLKISSSLSKWSEYSKFTFISAQCAATLPLESFLWIFFSLEWKYSRSFTKSGVLFNFWELVSANIERNWWINRLFISKIKFSNTSRKICLTVSLWMM